MSSYLVYAIIAIIAILSVLATAFISLKSKKSRLFKYLPSILTAASALVFCIIETIAYPGGYIGIVYVVVLLISSPVILLSLIIAISFDIYGLYKNKKNKPK